MQHQRQACFFCDHLNSFKIKLRFKFIIAVRIAYRNCQRIYSGPGCIVRGNFRICIIITWILQPSGALIISDVSQFAFHRHAHRMADFYHFSHLLRILLITHGGTVIHYRCKSKLHRLHTTLKCQPVVIMDTDRHRGLLRHRDQVFSHPLQSHCRKQYLGSSYHDRRMQFFSGLDHRPRHLHIDRVKKTHAIPFFLSRNQQIIHCH